LQSQSPCTVLFLPHCCCCCFCRHRLIVAFFLLLTDCYSNHCQLCCYHSTAAAAAVAVAPVHCCFLSFPSLLWLLPMLDCCFFNLIFPCPLHCCCFNCACNGAVPARQPCCLNLLVAAAMLFRYHLPLVLVVVAVSDAATKLAKKASTCLCKIHM